MSTKHMLVRYGATVLLSFFFFFLVQSQTLKPKLKNRRDEAQPVQKRDKHAMGL